MGEQLGPRAYRLVEGVDHWALADDTECQLDESGALVFRTMAVGGRPVRSTTLVRDAQLPYLIRHLVGGGTLYDALNASAIPRADWNYAVRVLRSLVRAGYLVPDRTLNRNEYINGERADAGPTHEGRRWHG
jgi:hypothetical protein